MTQTEFGLVSVIMPVFNSEQFVGESIQSVLNQTYQNWELVVIDDASTDSSLEIVQEFSRQDSRIRILQHSESSGAAISRNDGLREAKGRWIAFLDSDDLWFPTKLEQQLAFMVTNNYHFSYTNYEEIMEDGQQTGYGLTGPKTVNRLKLLTCCFVGCLTVMYDRDKVGLLQVPEDLTRRNDYALWLKVSHHATAYLLDSVQASYRVRTTGSLTNRQAGPHSLVKYHIALFRQSEQFSLPLALFWTGMNIVVTTIKKKVYRRSLSQLTMESVYDDTE
ncbi:glycosyltransferase family 2 protein [Streptococcus suis]|uniref:glycosyltransferase family 2 protein n=1 Tax=Streptococcus suis TaxID=1307 RepID=UPI001ABE9F38|nr:glycosyltransferase family 2 protein [Streptococcus suis]MBO4127289.1 glycosyltransferase family 2 protein [Streptococcus suis]WFA75461.1 glycosyltransferase family 2 protein [Streptococcus suis]